MSGSNWNNMSHTLRIYNNPRLKKTQRYNLDDMSDIHPLLNIHISSHIGIPYTRRSWICMGKCPQCRNPKKEPRKLRRQRKELLRFNLKEEISIP